MPTTCTITFDDNPQKVCYSGTLLKGSVHLNLTSEKTLRGIFIKIKGEAYCHWSEGSGKNKRSYSGEEDYLNERTYFVGDSHGKQNILTTHSYMLQPQHKLSALCLCIMRLSRCALCGVKFDLLFG